MSTPERTERVKTGAISAMGASLAQLTESAKTAARLQEQIAAGDVILEIAPELVDASFISDRLTLPVDPSFDSLVESMAASGQQVPILVRPHPEQSGRYQAAYGHRRLRAAGHLGIKIKAVVRALSDNELVVAQGKENLERRDLSFIERALFAKKLEERRFDRSVIISALSCDKADVSRYLALARAVPEALATAIGPAPKAGRSRWAALVERLARPGAGQALENLVSSAEFLALDSDLRFIKVLESIGTPNGHGKTGETWVARDGRKIARVERSPGRFVLSFDEKIAPAFGDYVLRELDSLLAAYERTLEVFTE